MTKEIKLRWYQEEAEQATIDSWKRGLKKPLVCLPTGCHALGHLILMSDLTTKKVEEICVGDKVMGPDGSPRTVVKLHHGSDEMYRITPITGDSFVVNKDHILSLTKISQKKNPKYESQFEKIVNVSVKDYLSFTKWAKHLCKLQRFGVNSPNIDLPIDPYSLGVLLGDGCLIDGVSVSKPDIEIEDWAKEFAKSWNVNLRIKDGICKSYHFSKIKGDENSISKSLKDLNLFNKNAFYKFIPELYKRSGTEQRYSILAGLLDTDGHLNSNGCYDWITASSELADDFVFICRSLGLSASVVQTKKFCQTGSGGIYYRVCVSGELSYIPCRIKRKQASKRLQIKDVTRTGFSVESIGFDYYYGFELDGDHLYLDGAFTRHHNSGKAPTLCSLIIKFRKWYPNKNVIATVHTKELVAQLADTYRRMSGEEPGIYSASLRIKDARKVTFAQMQSIYKKEFKNNIGLVVIDECDRVPVEGEGQYRTLMDSVCVANPECRFVGLTATPYRLGSGLVYGEGQPWQEMVYDADIATLIKEGYLSNLVSRNGGKPNLLGVRTTGGDYNQSDLDDVMCDDSVLERAVNEIVSFRKSRNYAIYFSPGKKHAEKLSKKLYDKGIRAPVVHSEMPAHERDSYISQYKQGILKDIININILTIGFDASHIDMLVMTRPTKSAALYYQMIGRGLRIHPDKKDCLVLDLAGNIEFHGPIDTLNKRMTNKQKPKSEEPGDVPMKQCPGCEEFVHAAVRVCPHCDFAFPEADLPHGSTATDLSPLSGSETRDVESVFYLLNAGKDGKPPTIKVTYKLLGGSSVNIWLSCDVKSHSYAYNKFRRWLMAQKFINQLDDKTRTPKDWLTWIRTNAKHPLKLTYSNDGSKYKEILQFHHGD